MKIGFSQRIAFKLARLSVLVAFLLGVVVSIAQVYTDFHQQSEVTKSKVDEIFEVTRETAERAVYQLDPDLAREVLQGLTHFNFLQFMSFLDDRDEVMAEITLPLKESSTRNITKILISESSTHEFRLTNHQGVYLGKLVLMVDTDAALAPFYNRAVYVFISGLVRNFVLSIVLLLVFQYALSRPFLRLAEKFQKIDIHGSQKHQLLQHDRAHQYDEVGHIVDSANAMMEEILALNTRLEEKVGKRTTELENTNDDLQTALQEIKHSQQKLVEKEKMASLGQLVAGVAHEVNTPLGICVAANSFLHELHRELEGELDRRSLNSKKIRRFLDQSSEGLDITTSSLKRASQLINEFKKVAAKQSIKNILVINLKQELDDIQVMLQPELSQGNHRLAVDCQDIEVACDAEALSQIVSNLVFNSLQHGFEGVECGNIFINVDVEDTEVVMNYRDDGVGVTEEVLTSLFEPFFTTNRSLGGVGLGTHIVYNLVTHVLAGSISAKSEANQGLKFEIRFPKVNPIFAKNGFP